MNKIIAKLALEDGTVFSGQSFGAQGTTQGQVVFGTGMMGYQELLTSPMGYGQIIVMTFPLIGAYGINPDDNENRQPISGGGLVVREAAAVYSHHLATQSIQQFMQEHKIVGISDIDTRALTRHIRNHGEMRGVISTEILDDKQLVAKAKQATLPEGNDWVNEVKPIKSYPWTQGLGAWSDGNSRTSGRGLHVVAIDCGAKTSELRHLVERGVKLTVVPPDTTVEKLLVLKPDGVYLSSGPGDPSAPEYLIKLVRDLVGKLPIFGVDLGFQVLALALGAKSTAMKVGHRGGNQPVINLETKLIEVVELDHGFVLDKASLEKADAIVTHVHLNDKTVAGFRHKTLPLFGVQFHPESHPGPRESAYLFDVFIDTIRLGQSPTPDRFEQAKTLQG